MTPRPKKRPVGRPAMRPQDKRRVMNLTLAPEDHAWIARATDAGWPSISAYVSSLIRRAQISDPRGPPAPEV